MLYNMSDTNENFDQLERLDRYLDGDLPAPDRQALEQQLAQDTSLRETLDLLRLSRDAVRTKGLQQQVRSHHQRWINRARESTLSPAAASASGTEAVTMPSPAQSADRATSFRFVWRVAAAVLLGVIGYSTYQYTTADTNILYDEHYLSYEIPRTRDDASMATPIDELYNQQQYADVLRAYESQSSPSSRDHFLAAMSALEQNDYIRAIRLFTEVQHTESFEQETDYYLALAYLQAGQVDQARTLFQKISDTPRHLYHENVSKGDLRTLWWLQWK